MKLYRVSSESVGKNVTKWSGTQADSKKDKKAMKDNGNLFIEIEEIDVPTDKAGLLKWLNENAVK